MAVTIYDLKPRFQALLRPLVARLAAAGVTANQVTMFAALGINPESHYTDALNRPFPVAIGSPIAGLYR